MTTGRLLTPVLFGVLVLATVAAFAVVEDERDHPQIVGDDKVSRAFAPQAPPGSQRRRQMRVTFTITRAEPHATIVVQDANGEVVSTLADDVPLADDGTYEFLWDGRLDDGRIAPPGRYRVRVLLQELDRDLPLDAGELLPAESGG